MKNKTIEELKVLAYDLVGDYHKIGNTLKVIDQEITKRELEKKKKTKKKEK